MAGLSRRGFLLAAAGAAAATALTPPKKRLLQMNGYPIDAETPLELLGESYLTPNDLFFIRHHWNPVFPDMSTWKLVIDGEVERPQSLSLADLKAMPQASATCVLQCAGNGRSLHRPIVPGVQWKYGAVGNAKWTGVRVKDLLAKAGVKAGARHLHTFGTDVPPEKVPPFHRSVEMDKILEDGIVALSMSGAPLPQLHGGPARLVVPGWAGDHWMKWLARVSPQPEPQTGFYMDVGYRYPKNPGAPGVAFKPEEMSPVTELFVKSNITSFPAEARVGKKATIRGIAFSGAPDVAKVEVSENFGMTWTDATLGKDHDPFAWRLWSYDFLPKAAGKTTLVARATDSKGNVQPQQAVWNQSGYLYNAWPTAEITVAA